MDRRVDVARRLITVTAEIARTAATTVIDMTDDEMIVMSVGTIVAMIAAMTNVVNDLRLVVVTAMINRIAVVSDRLRRAAMATTRYIISVLVFDLQVDQVA